MKSRVFAYAPLGPAPLDSPAMRAAIADKVRWLFFNELIRLDAMHPVELAQGIVCYPAILNSDGTSSSGVGLRFVVKDGAIQGVETALSSECASSKQLIEDYEAQKPGKKTKKHK